MPSPYRAHFEHDATDEDGDSDGPPLRRSRPYDIEPLSALNSTTTSRSESPEPLATPTLSQSYSHMRKNLSFKSLRELEMKEVQKAVWRRGGRGEPGEKRHRPRNLDELLSYALRGGGRSFALGYSLRAGINLVVAALRLSRKRGISSRLLLHALFGPDNLRFGCMLGGFTFLYKWSLHFLRIFNLGPLGSGKVEFWHAPLAGAIAGLSVWCEKASRRVTIGQQMFVRGLQGNYNVAKKNGYINIPHGDVILFGLACGQIMYSWIMAPEALPPGYRRWMTNAARIPEPMLPINLSASRYGTFDPSIARSTMLWKSGATEKNRVLIEAYALRAEEGDFGPPFAPCEVIHPWMDTCTGTAVDRWQAVFRWMFPVYGALHLIPPILLRHKVFLKNPQRVLIKAAVGTLRSCSFLSTFVTFFQGLICIQRNIYKKYGKELPEWAEQLLVHKGYYWFVGFMTCFSLFIEEKKRRGELAMYVLPRGLESLWSILRRREWVPFVPGGEILLTSVGMSLVMNTYEHHPKNLSGLVRSVLWQLLGR